MALKFFNIRNKEIRVAETEPMISAMWSSSDRGPNVQQGQDFGWRLAPEVVVELKRIRQDFQKMQEIAVRYAKPLEDVKEPDILQYISDRTDLSNAPVAQDGDYTDEYEAEVRMLESIDKIPEEQKTIEQLEQELAARRALENPIPKTATTSTTTENLTTTTTTVKVK